MYFIYRNVTIQPLRHQGTKISFVSCCLGGRVNSYAETMAKQNEKKFVEIFTDGACKGNPGPGGWGVILRFGEHEKELSGFSPSTTNNRMELLAAIRALESLKKSCRVILTTDSTYLKNGITTWIHDWKKRGWRKSNKKPVENVDLWQHLDTLAAQHRIEWHWIRGHKGHPENERADKLAVSAIKNGLAGQINVDSMGIKK